ncbi:MAG: hypothetical protein AB7P18_36985 [Candidatus Binatia bacterium]
MFAGQLGTLSGEEVGDLCVPLDDCITVKPGAVDREAVSSLEAHGYDQAPVYDRERPMVYGLVTTAQLNDLMRTGAVLDGSKIAEQADQYFFRIGAFITIEQLFDKLAQERAALVIRESNATEYGLWQSCLGLLTISDLNRHQLRASLYSILSTLESALARLVERFFADPWEWVKTLNEAHQVGVLGYWELSKRRGVDIGPIAATTLAQLIQVISRNKELLLKIGYSRTQFEGQTGQIPELRNSVMHPVRPLILDQSDVKRANQIILNVLDLIKKIETVAPHRQNQHG